MARMNVGDTNARIRSSSAGVLTRLGPMGLNRIALAAAIVCAVLSLASRSASATDFALIAGHGDGLRTIAVAGTLGDWGTGLVGEHWLYEIAGEWQLARWSADRLQSGVDSLIDGSVTAVLTLRPDRWRRTWFEAGFGVHGLSENRIGPDRELGWRFQFGEFVGTGLNLGAKRQYAIGMRIQHGSNGSLKAENDGATFIEGVARYRF